jgi:hypothetical protein
MTPSHEQISQEAAERAVKKVFAILGVDVDKPKEVEEFRADLRFGRSMRKATNHGVLVVVAGIVTGVCVATWTGVTNLLGRH